MAVGLTVLGTEGITRPGGSLAWEGEGEEKEEEASDSDCLLTLPSVERSFTPSLGMELAAGVLSLTLQSRPTRLLKDGVGCAPSPQAPNGSHTETHTGAARDCSEDLGASSRCSVHCFQSAAYGEAPSAMVTE